MKKALFVLVIIIFVVCAVLGFEAAAKLSSGRSSQGQQNVNSALAETQKNYLLVHVTDLSSDSPQLVAVWELLVFYSQPPQIILVPLFPSSDDSLMASIKSTFKVGKNGELDARFINEIEKKFDITTIGYVAVDNAGLSVFYKWITQQDLQISAGTPTSSDQKHIVLINGQQFFQTACSQFSQSGVKGFLDQIRWTDLIPLHFSTNLSFESLALASDIFKAAGNISQCSVLSDE